MSMEDGESHALQPEIPSALTHSWHMTLAFVDFASSFSAQVSD